MTNLSKSFAVRTVVAGGGGGLMLDLTPDFAVTLMIGHLSKMPETSED